MILKGFKEKSNKKYINSQLKNRVISNSKQKIKRVGVIVNAEENIDTEWFKTLAKDLDIKSGKIEIIAFKSEIMDEEKVYNPTYNLKHIGWNGAIKNSELKQFLSTTFDVLISYYKNDDTALKVLTAKSNAIFKIGILEADERLNDLIIKTKTTAFKTFKTEVIKYLKILNKI